MREGIGGVVCEKVELRSAERKAQEYEKMEM